MLFANKPKLETRVAIAEMGQGLIGAHGLQGHVMDAGRLHVTLASAWAEHLSLQEAIWRAQNLAMEIRGAPCLARFDLSGSFRSGDRYPFVLRSGNALEALGTFRDALRRVMRRSGFAVSSNFAPHMTLIWADRPVEDNPIAPISWPVEDFELVLSADGDHIQLGCWSLIS